MDALTPLASKAQVENVIPTVAPLNRSRLTTCMHILVGHCSLYFQQSRGDGTIIQLNYAIQILSMKDEQSILVILHELDLQHSRLGFSQISELAHAFASILTKTNISS